MSTQERHPSRVGLTIGSTRQIGEFDFSKISVSLERDLAPAENPIDAYRDIKALLERMVIEFQAGKPAAKTNGNEPAPPGPPVSKLVTLQERLGKRLQDLEITDGMDGLVVKPRRYLGEAWAEVNAVVRELGGKWHRGEKSADDSWRVPK